jgi:hypothetical protein
LIALLANRNWLDDATKTISQYWRRKNARRNDATIKRSEISTPELTAESQKIHASK